MPGTAEEVSGKPRPSRSMSTGGVQSQRGKTSEGLRKHSADATCRVSDAEYAQEQEGRSQSPQHGKREHLDGEGDDEMDALMRRVQKQRSVLGEILEQEDSRGKEGKTCMKDKDITVFILSNVRVDYLI